MKRLIKKVLRTYLKSRTIITTWVGKNRGFKFIYSDDYNLDMMLGLHEPNSFEVFGLFLKKGMVVADIGANFGYFSRFLSRSVGLTGKVFCFEPVPETHRRLAQTYPL